MGLEHHVPLFTIPAAVKIKTYRTRPTTIRAVNASSLDRRPTPLDEVVVCSVDLNSVSRLSLPITIHESPYMNFGGRACEQ